MSESSGARIYRETCRGLGEAVIEHLTEGNFDWLEERESRVVKTVLDQIVEAHPELADSEAVASARAEWVTSEAVVQEATR